MPDNKKSLMEETFDAANYLTGGGQPSAIQRKIGRANILFYVTDLEIRLTRILDELGSFRTVLERTLAPDTSGVLEYESREKFKSGGNIRKEGEDQLVLDRVSGPIPTVRPIPDDERRHSGPIPKEGEKR